jgi:hypothetical protein
VDNQERLTNHYLIPQENDNVSDSKQHQRPLSIVSEEANGGYHLLTRSLSAKGDSRLSDTSYKSSIDTAMSAYSKISARPPLRKSSSITTPTGGSPYELNSSGRFSSIQDSKRISILSADFLRILGYKYERRCFLEVGPLNFWKQPPFKSKL